MARQNSSKLNHFMVSAPQGVVLTTDWLEKQGISTKLAWWYVRGGLLERLSSKAYKKTGDMVNWLGAVAALQWQLRLPIHIGSKTALQLVGLSHYLPLQGPKQIFLFTTPLIRIPSWLEKANLWDVDFIVHKTSLFPNHVDQETIVERTINSINVKLSCPERAVMEMLHLVPNEESLDEVVLLIEGLSQLRPNIIQLLLENCHSIKVKRLFLYLSEKFRHEWFSILNTNKINLGHGKRVIGRGGHYDTKYQLSIPIITEDNDEI